MMTPQLFINYKLKSVAHMPWKMMTYKALNTFIDDLFAFIIKMPWLHRLACLRDGAYVPASVCVRVPIPKYIRESLLSIRHEVSLGDSGVCACVCQYPST